MSSIEYLRIYADENGCSHFETGKSELSASSYAPPAPNLNTSTIETANKYVFLELPIGWSGDWHPTPVRQWLALMSGECEFEAGDGEREKKGPVILFCSMIQLVKDIKRGFLGRSRLEYLPCIFLKVYSKT